MSPFTIDVSSFPLNPLQTYVERNIISKTKDHNSYIHSGQLREITTENATNEFAKYFDKNMHHFYFKVLVNLE